jgi:hypothetical protein
VIMQRKGHEALASEGHVGQLAGKVGIITGAASGIGAACARVMASERSLY